MRIFALFLAASAWAGQVGKDVAVPTVLVLPAQAAPSLQPFSAQLPLDAAVPGASFSAELRDVGAGLVGALKEERIEGADGGTAVQSELDAKFDGRAMRAGEEAVVETAGDDAGSVRPAVGPKSAKSDKAEVHQPAVSIPGRKITSFLGAPVHSTVGAATWVGWGVTYQLFWDAVSPLSLHFWLGSFVFGAALVFTQLFHDAAQVAALKRLGVKVERVELTALGGRVVYEAPDGKPWTDFAAVAAGPAANLGVAALAFGAAALIGGPGAFLLTSLAQVNVSMTLFNLILSPTLDGGRLLRNFLQAWLGDPQRAWVVAARIGVGFGLFSMVAPVAFWGLFDPVRTVMIVLAGLLGAALSWRGRRGPP